MEKVDVVGKADVTVVREEEGVGMCGWLNIWEDILYRRDSIGQRYRVIGDRE
jgi:uncharacterized protein YunC (DUF1805 family)